MGRNAGRGQVQRFKRKSTDMGMYKTERKNKIM